MIFLTDEDKVFGRQVGPLNNEEHPWKVPQGTKGHEEEKSHVGSERNTWKSISKRHEIHSYLMFMIDFSLSPLHSFSKGWHTCVYGFTSLLLAQVHEEEGSCSRDFSEGK